MQQTGRIADERGSSKMSSGKADGGKPTWLREREMIPFYKGRRPILKYQKETVEKLVLGR